MSKLLRAAAAAALLTLAISPAASAAIPRPPLDPGVRIDFGGGCSPPPDNPCDPRPGSITYDQTYPSRVVAWAEGILP